MAQNTRKPFGGWGSAPDPAEGAYSPPKNPLVGGEGLAVSVPTQLSALAIASPTPTPKLVPTPMGWNIHQWYRQPDSQSVADLVLGCQQLPTSVTQLMSFQHLSVFGCK